MMMFFRSGHDRRIRQLGQNDKRRKKHSNNQRRNIIIFIYLLTCFVVGIVIIYIRMAVQISTSLSLLHQQQRYPLLQQPTGRSNPMERLHLSIHNININNNTTTFVENPKVSYNVHAFYYPWYCNPSIDGKYMHWNHVLLDHWDPKIAIRYPHGYHHNPNQNDIGASYYPLLGTYSSADPTIIHHHMIMLEQAGIGVAVVSWLPQQYHDDNGPPLSSRLRPILDIAFLYGIKIAIHMEPYPNRTVSTFRQDVIELVTDHGHHPALYRRTRPSSGSDVDAGSSGGKPSSASGGGSSSSRRLLPVLYVYDQYRLPTEEWKQVLAEPTSTIRTGSSDTGGSSLNIRNTIYDAVVLALIVEVNHWKEYVLDANFDGGYTYFAANTFTFGSKPKNWKRLQNRAIQDKKLFIPSVGPGYDDERVRPWNYQNTKPRNEGTYFDAEWKTAIDSDVSIISITSFNEWHEGTQIEPAIPQQTEDQGRGGKYVYHNYELEGGPYAYLNRNRKWVERFMDHHHPNHNKRIFKN